MECFSEYYRLECCVSHKPAKFLGTFYTHKPLIVVPTIAKGVKQTLLYSNYCSLRYSSEMFEHMVNLPTSF